MKPKGKRTRAQKVPPRRRPYKAPAIVEEQVFERQALQQCDKTGALPQCTEGLITS